ncbi:MAG: T9SS type A sorting domain-containing protein [Bacteroidia bacterium]
MKKFFLFAFIIASIAKQSHSQGVWTQKADLGGGKRGGAVGFSIGNKGYIGIGDTATYSAETGDNYATSFWEFDPNGNGVNEINLDNLISVYPNPSSGKINLKISQFENLKIKNIVIYNLQGEKVYSAADFQINSSSNFQIDLSEASSGIYFIHIICNEGTAVKKIIIQ